MSLTDRLKALLSISTYQPNKGYGYELDDSTVENIRSSLGGQIQPLPQSQIRWYVADLESAVHSADSGDISSAARLYRAMRRDGVISGLLGTLTGGIVRMPKKFYGDSDIINDLRARNGSRAVFDDMVPANELALLAADGKALGVGVAELVPVPGRNYPVMVRLDPEFLRYRWVENRWYFNSMAGPLPITPGDGRWVLHVPSGRMNPWTVGLWHSLGRAFIHKEHAYLHRANYSAKLANPARAATAPIGATEEQRQGFIKRVIAWGINTVFELPPGWDVKLIESNGRGHDVFQADIDAANNEIMIALAGQIVTTDGGAGFSNSDIHRMIRDDIIQDMAETLSYTLNTQVLPPYIANTYGEEALDSGTVVEWEIKKPKDMNTEALTLTYVTNALPALAATVAKLGRGLDVDELLMRFGIPQVGDENALVGSKLKDPSEQTVDESGEEDEEAEAKKAAEDISPDEEAPAPKMPKVPGLGAN